MTKRENSGKNSQRLRFRTILLLVGSLGTVLVFCASLAILWTILISNTQHNNAANELAHIVADLAQACGEGSSIEGLHLFLRNMEKHEMLDGIHVYRTQVTARDFGERDDSVPPDQLELEVLKDGVLKEIVNKKAHTIRYVRPTFAEESCVRRCHESAKVGDILGIASITVHTGETDAARAKLNWLLVMVFAMIGIAEVIFVIVLLAKENAERNRQHAEQTSRKLKTYVDDIEKLARDAHAANKAKSQFLANMSHEIRTPMNGIIGFSDILSDENLTVQQRESVNIIRECGRNLLTLIDDILDFSKIESGQLDIEIIDCSLGELLGSVESLMRPKAKEKEIDFEIVEAGSLPAVIRTDPTRLRQCLINLVGNAIKFTEKGHVRVHVSLQESNEKASIRFDVEDTGIGISPEKQQVVFDAFTQADADTTRKYGGTGLGLAITRQLAGLLGGQLTLTSDPGKGSVFSLTIPAGIDVEKQPLLDRDGILKRRSASKNNAKHARLSGNILVAEDAKTNQILIKSLLERLGLHVTIAEDGRQAVQMVLNNQFDLILMDIQMPFMNGYEATQILRKKGIQTPIVALTANAMKGDDERCLAAGCDAYLPKPIEREQLVKTISSYVSQDDNILSDVMDTLAGRVDKLIETCSEAGTCTDHPMESTDVPHNDQVVDWALIWDWCGDEDVVKEAVGIFLEDGRYSLERIANAIEADDPENVKLYAHRLKGSARHVAARQLSEKANDLERAGRAKDMKTTALLFAQVQREFERVTSFLSEPNWMETAKQS